MHFNKIAIIGVGLLGGSFAKAVKERQIANRVTGYGRSEDNLKRAVSLEIIDDYDKNLKTLCGDADLVMIASPVGTFPDISRSLAMHLKKGAILTDVGSVKGNLVYTIEKELPEGVHYVGAHPIAGDNRSGIDAASSTLFNGAMCIVTPTTKTDVESLNRIKDLWERLGAVVKELTPELHDIIYSSVSHLPHLVSYALINSITTINSDFLIYSGKGLLDTTRIAMSSPEIWKDISILNKDNIINHLEIFKDNIDILINYLKIPDKESISRELEKACDTRKQLEKK